VPEQMNFNIGADEKKLRIDKCIALRLGEDYSRTYVKYLLDNGLAKVNDNDVKPSYHVVEGDTVSVDLVQEEREQSAEPENIPLDILYEDEAIIVINKPVGLVVHPGAGNKDGTMVNALLFHCGTLPHSDDELKPGIVHRLDKDTSGVIIVAKNDKALRSLSKQFRDRTVKKEYITIVKGRIELDNCLVDQPLARHEGDRRKMCVDAERGKEARSIYHTLRRFKKFTFLRIITETGRTHQIRVHMQFIGHSIIGDLRYGGPPFGMDRQALHAAKLEITHPVTRERMCFTAPMPDDIKRVLDKAEKEEKE